MQLGFILETIMLKIDEFPLQLVRWMMLVAYLRGWPGFWFWLHIEGRGYDTNLYTSSTISILFYHLCKEVTSKMYTARALMSVYVM